MNYLQPGALNKEAAPPQDSGTAHEDAGLRGTPEPANVKETVTEVMVKGKPVMMPAIEMGGLTIVVSGRRLKIAAVKDEEFLDGEAIADPGPVIAQLKTTRLRPDIFTFAQKLPNVAPRHSYYREWENFAAIPITTYADWLDHRVTYDVRKAVRRAQRSGVEARKADYDDELVQGICTVYNETRYRQGKAFWHYQKDFATVKKENATFADRACFIGAYIKGELVGFIKMVYVGSYAATIQVLSQVKHRREKASNAMIAKAVEICVEKGLSHFVYGRYVYNNPDSSLTEFKRRNGFEPILVPRYYVPLTAKGAIALKFRLHRPLSERIPMSLRPVLHRVRGWLRHKSHDAGESDGGVA